MNNDKIFIGIDPGSKGAMCVMWPQAGDNANPFDPFTPGHITLLSFETENPYKIADTLRLAKERGKPIAAIEDVHSMPHDGGKQAFKFGYNVGMVQGFLIALSIPYVTVRPQEWQSEVWVRQDKVMLPGKPREDGKKSPSKADPKKTSINAARRLFPDVSLMRTRKCTVPSDGLTDALLICEYARRKNL